MVYQGSSLWETGITAILVQIVSQITEVIYFANSEVKSRSLFFSYSKFFLS